MLGRRARVALLAAAVALGVATPAAGAGGGPPARSQVVVAVADAGINPYHRAFLRPKNTAHPCTYVPGFTDCSIPALHLSVGVHDYATAVHRDRQAWAAVEPGQWYWIPRTNIIGAVCDPDASAPPPQFPDHSRPPSWPGPRTTCILDETDASGPASSVLTEAPDALLLVHDGDATAARLKSAPVVPDVQVHSWAPPAPVPSQAAAAGGEQLCPEAFRRPETLFFLAAGDGAPVPALAGCARQHSDVHVVGGAFPGHMSYTSWSAYDFASWHCRPVVRRSQTSAVHPACGTKLSAATAAGAAAAALKAVREHDRYRGRSTKDRVSRTVPTARFVEALRAGASYAPKAKFSVPGDGACTAVMCSFGWAPLPEQGAHLAWGYGWLDSTVAPVVAACALGRDCPVKPEAAQRYNEARQSLRAAGRNAG